MGTRHLVIVYYKGKYVIAQYGQWDGYPSGEGLHVLEFARDPELIAKLAAALDAGMVYKPTKEELKDIYDQMDEMEKMFLEKKRQALEKRQREAEKEAQAKCKPAKMDINRLSAQQQAYNIVCPSLSRDSGAQILKLVAGASEKIPVMNDLGFITDGLCEWSWVLDLDARALECWRGEWGDSELPGEPEQSTRFDHLAAIQSGRGNRPKLMASFPLDNLPDESTFLRECGEPKPDMQD